jgi:CheY-like chemotaxis protein
VGQSLLNPPEAPKSDGRAHTPTILLVEDEVLVRLTLAEVLRDQGYGVIEASNADEAIIVLRSQARIDLVFSDIRMPGEIDGVALARTVRASRPNLKIILASAFGPAIDVHLGVHGFIRKPYNLGEVLQRIRDLIGE